MELTLHRLQPGTITPAEEQALTAVIMAAPAYSLCVAGRLPEAQDVSAFLHDLPPGYRMDDKFTFAINLQGRMIGCADILRGWKHERQSMLGLLLLAEEAQGRGLGRAAWRMLEQQIAGWPGMASVRIGVVSTNEKALAFWRRIGFIATGERVSLPGYTGPTLIFEKPLAA